jgi:hypothetical protein
MWRIYVKDGQDPANNMTNKPSLLDKSTDWEQRVDLDRRLVFPDVAETTLRPGIIILLRQ